MFIPLQEGDLYAHLFCKRLVSLLDPKNLETLKSRGGVGAIILHGLRVHSNSSEHRNRDTYHAVTCKSATRNLANPDALEAETKAFSYH
jgi:hypothetical protein